MNVRTSCAPMMPARMLRLSYMTAAAEGLADICAQDPANPYLPKIYEQRTVTSNPPLSITVLERLYAPCVTRTA